MGSNELDYFYGNEADMYSFFKIPKILFTNPDYKLISMDAKVLYGLMLDRISLSVKNKWFDDKNRAYIFFSVEDTMNILNCGRNKAVEVIKELDKKTGVGLIEKKRQGLGKPTVFYVKNFVNQDEKKCVVEFEKQTSGSLNNKLLEVGKEDSNNTKYNNTKESNKDLIKGTDAQNDLTMKYKAYEKIIRKNLDMENLYARRPYDKEMLDGIYELILEMIMNQNATVVIARNEYPSAMVKTKFMKLNSTHVEYVLDCLEQTENKIKNIKKYLLAALFNASSTIEGYYQMKVKQNDG